MSKIGHHEHIAQLIEYGSMDDRVFLLDEPYEIQSYNFLALTLPENWSFLELVC